jgi:hypothetical protein
MTTPKAKRTKEKREHERFLKQVAKLSNAHLDPSLKRNPSGTHARRPKGNWATKKGSDRPLY